MSTPFDPYYAWLGIPPAEQPADYYRLLGLRPFEENVDAIQSALDQRMHFLRTLQAGPRSALSQSLLNEISRVGACLLNRSDKAEYDRKLRSELAQREAAQRAVTPAIPVLQLAPTVDQAAAGGPVVVAPPARAPSPRKASGFDWQSHGGWVLLAAIGLPVAAFAGVGIVRWAGSSPEPIAAAPREPIAPVPPGVMQEGVRSPARSNSARQNSSPSEARPFVPPPGPAPQPGSTAIAAANDASKVESPGESPAPPQPEAPSIPAAPPPRSAAARPVNLLPSAEVKFRVLRGSIQHGPGSVRTDKVSTAFAVPLEWPEQYVLEADVTRITGKNSLCFGFLVQGRPLTAIIDGFDSKRSGLARIGDFEIFSPKSPFAVNGALLANGVESTVRIEVTRASVTLMVDDRPISRWNIDPQVPIRAAQGMSWMENEAVCIYTWDARYQFKRLELLPLTKDD